MLYLDIYTLKQHNVNNEEMEESQISDLFGVCDAEVSVTLGKR